MKRTALLALVAVSALSAPALAPTPAAAQYGPDTCRPGFVWREAFPGDHVCVRLWVRSETRMDNANRARPHLRQWAVRQRICLARIVPGDHVCVPPETRERAAHDNYRADLSPRLLDAASDQVGKACPRLSAHGTAGANTAVGPSGGDDAGAGITADPSACRISLRRTSGRGANLPRGWEPERLVVFHKSSVPR